MAEPLNPFLRAFSTSSTRTQCSPAEHAILAPTYESIVDAFDKDTRSGYSDLVRTEDFIASHVIRMPVEVVNGKDTGAARENRNKPRQYYSVNGKVIIIRESSVFAAKGFKFANQAQIVGDGLWYRDGQKQDPWPVIYLHKPLVGNYEPRPVQTVILPAKTESNHVDGHAESSSGGRGLYREDTGSEIMSPSSPHPKRQIRSFVELLANFPQIERSLRPHLERIFKTLKEEVERPASPQSLSGATAVGTLSRTNTATSDMSSISSHSHGRPMSIRSMRSTLGEQIPVLEITREEEVLRSAVDTAIRSAIDAFQNIDRSFLNHLTSSTDLEGPAIDAMIERFILERIHGLYLFHKVCTARAADELQVDFRKVKDVDPIQVGVEVDEERDARSDLAARLTKGVEEFRKTATANSPHLMLEVLNETLKILTSPARAAPSPPTEALSPQDSEASADEKQHSALSFNADTLVSLLLAVVIRSQVQYLKSRLSYMRHFVFCEDVETGINGYALSTLEVVLSYIDRESQPLMEATRRNRKLWAAIKQGDMNTTRHMLGFEAAEDTNEVKSDEELTISSESAGSLQSNGYTDQATHSPTESPGLSSDSPPIFTASPDHESPPEVSFDSTATDPTTKKPKPRISFAASVRSHSIDSLDTNALFSPEDASPSDVHPALDADLMARIRTSSGASIARLAIEAHQKEILDFILKEIPYWKDPKTILLDCDISFQTLLMAALRTGETPIIKCIMTRLEASDIDPEERRKYINTQDLKGRAVGHYLYDYRPLILSLGNMVDWRQKDSAGRTPLVSICRSYDSLGYRQMVEDALSAATAAQENGQPLLLDEHLDERANTLLHIIANPQLVRKILHECSCDINAVNSKSYTPLITAAKYGRLDVIRVLFADPRLNPFFKDPAGFTAVELAKSESVRQLIDDLTLLRYPSTPDGRITSIVRVAIDRTGATSLLLKHTVNPPSSSSVTICSSWRSLSDFHSLASCLSAENPASWMPTLNVRALRNPISVASRNWLRLDASRWLNTILMHPAFGQHELVWEFFLLPELDWPSLSERSRRKAELRAEAIREEHDPITDPDEIVQVIQTNQIHAGEVDRGLSGVVRRSRGLELACADQFVAFDHSHKVLGTLGFLSPRQRAALVSAAEVLAPPDNSPLTIFSADMAGLTYAARALSGSLTRIPRLVANMHEVAAGIERLQASAKRSERVLPGFLADTRARVRADAEKKAEGETQRYLNLGKEVSASRDTVVSEMAQLEVWRENEVKSCLKRFVKGMVLVEKERLRGVEVALKKFREG